MESWGLVKIIHFSHTKFYLSQYSRPSVRALFSADDNDYQVINLNMDRNRHDRLSHLFEESGEHLLSVSDIPYCNTEEISMEAMFPFYSDLHQCQVDSGQHFVFYDPRHHRNTGNNPTLPQLHTAQILTSNFRIEFEERPFTSHFQSHQALYPNAGPNSQIEGHSLFMNVCRERVRSASQDAPLEASRLYAYSQNLWLEHTNQVIPTYPISQIHFSRDEMMHIIFGAHLGPDQYRIRRNNTTHPPSYDLTLTGDWHVGEILTRWLDSPTAQRQFTLERRTQIKSAIELAIHDQATQSRNADRSNPYVSYMFNGFFGLLGLGATIWATNRGYNLTLKQMGLDDTSILDQFTNITQKARDNRLTEPIITATQTHALENLAIELFGNGGNPILRADAGRGKTTAFELMGLIGAGRNIEGLQLTPIVMDELRNTDVISISATDLMAGTTYRGQLEARIKKLVKEITALQKRTGRNYVLFIDEIHMLARTGGAGSNDIRETLKELTGGEGLHQIVRGRRCVIRFAGATTPNESLLFFSNGQHNVAELTRLHSEMGDRFWLEGPIDGALERRWGRVDVGPPRPGEDLEVLQGLARKMQNENHINITDSAVSRILQLSNQLRGNQPAKGRNLLNRIVTAIRLERSWSWESTRSPLNISETDVQTAFERINQASLQNMMDGIYRTLNDVPLSDEEIHERQITSIERQLPDIWGTARWEEMAHGDMGTVGRDALVEVIAREWNRATPEIRALSGHDGVSPDVPRRFLESFITRMPSPDWTPRHNLINRSQRGASAFIRRRNIDSVALRENILIRLSETHPEVANQTDGLQVFMEITEMVVAVWERDGFPQNEQNPQLPAEKYFHEGRALWQEARSRRIQMLERLQASGRISPAVAELYRTQLSPHLSPQPRVAQYNPTNTQSPWEADPALLQIRLDHQILRRSLEGSMRDFYENYLAEAETIEDLVNTLRIAYHENPSTADQILEESYRQACPRGRTLPTWQQAATQIISHIAIERGFESRPIQEVTSEMLRRIELRSSERERIQQERAEVLRSATREHE